MLYGALIGGIIGIIIFLFLMLIMKKKGGSARFSQSVPFSGDVAQMTQRGEELLKSQGYNAYAYGAETGIYRKGTGFATACKYIKFIAQEGGFLVEGFVDIYGTESGLTGFTAAIPKSTCKKTVNELINLIQNG